MSLASFNLETAGEDLRNAVLSELPKVQALREKIRALQVHELGYRQCFAVAPVATDGGENRLTFDPLNVEIVRVADSEGREHFQKFIALGGDPAQFEKYFREIPLLKGFLDRLGVTYRQLSYFLPGNKRHDDDQDKMGPSDEDLRKFVRSFRDIAEWAVLLELANTGKGLRMLVIRDGLLRSKSMSIPAMEAVAKAFRRSFDENATMLVGVAKRSKVLSYHFVSAGLGGYFAQTLSLFRRSTSGVGGRVLQLCRNVDAGTGFRQDAPG